MTKEDPKQQKEQKEQHQKEQKEQKEQITLNVETHLLHHVKLSLIYSALMDGWSVKKVPNHNKLCFSKKNIVKHYSLQTFLQTYMPKNQN